MTQHQMLSSSANCDWIQLRGWCRMLTCGGKMAIPHLCYSNWWGNLYVVKCEKMVWRDYCKYFSSGGTPTIYCCRPLIVFFACLPIFYFYMSLKRVYRDNLHASIKLSPLDLFFCWHWISSQAAISKLYMRQTIIGPLTGFELPWWGLYHGLSFEPHMSRFHKLRSLLLSRLNWAVSYYDTQLVTI